MLVQHDTALPAHGEASPIAHIYQRDSTDPSVLVADGHGVAITVQRGHLTIVDGIGRTRRVRRLPRVERTVRRVVVLARSGHITVEAWRWCADVGLTLVHLDHTGRLLAMSATPGTDDARLRRAQVHCGTGGTHDHVGLAVARYLLSVKLDGQAAIAADLGVARAADTIRHMRTRLDTESTLTAIRGREGSAAAAYWSAWSGRVIVPFDPRELVDVPAHWTTFVTRVSPIGTASTNGRDAADPINAMLNYAYRIAESESRLACVAVGLDPGMGFVHEDKLNRDSLALDILETVRPDVDRFVLGILSTFGPMTYLSRALFAEQRDGGARLVAPLTHRIAEQAGAWGGVVSVHAAQVARMVARAGKGEIRPTIAATRAHTRRTGSAHARVSLRWSGPATPGTIVSDDLWAQVGPLLPVPSSSRRGGRPFADARAVLAGIVCVELLGCTWSEIPPELGVSRYTCSARLAAWQRGGVWDQVVRVADTHEHVRRLRAEVTPTA